MHCMVVKLMQQNFSHATKLLWKKLACFFDVFTVGVLFTELFFSLHFKNFLLMIVSWMENGAGCIHNIAVILLSFKVHYLIWCYYCDRNRTKCMHITCLITWCNLWFFKKVGFIILLMVITLDFVMQILLYCIFLL